MPERQRPDWERRRDRVRKLAAAGSWDEVREMAADPRGEVRCEALDALRLGEPLGVVELLLEALADRARDVRRHAARMLLAADAEAVSELLAGLDRQGTAPWCAGILATTLPGRLALVELPDHGLGVLQAACEQPELPIRLMLGVCRALLTCRPAPAGTLLERLSQRESPLLRRAAARALSALRAALPQALATLEADPSRADLCGWLGDHGDPEALPLLHRLASPWRAWYVPTDTRHAAREAIELIEALLGDITDAAISPTTPPRLSPGEAALSLWAEPESPEEEAADDEDGA